MAVYSILRLDCVISACGAFRFFRALFQPSSKTTIQQHHRPPAHTHGSQRVCARPGPRNVEQGASQLNFGIAGSPDRRCNTNKNMNPPHFPKRPASRAEPKHTSSRMLQVHALIKFLSVRRKHLCGGPCPESGNSCARPLILCPSGLVGDPRCKIFSVRAHARTCTDVHTDDPTLYNSDPLGSARRPLTIGRATSGDVGTSSSRRLSRDRP